MEALSRSTRPGGELTGRTVLVTGHTGFKGAWLSLWLSGLGANVHGIALSPNDGQRQLFELVDGMKVFDSSQYLDISQSQGFVDAMSQIKPDFVFHLAAQPLVRQSYSDPVETFRSNVMGTVSVLEGVRQHGAEGVVCITSDKCYENVEQIWPYRETDPMGGHDPYSASKGCSELVIASYARSFQSSSSAVLASARAGNVIGGGDFASDRLVPDFFRAIESGSELLVRRPQSTRPWQHVLESLGGYLMLADAVLLSGAAAGGAWNFGPEPHEVRTVQEFLHLLSEATGQQAPVVRVQVDGPHEATRLALDVSKARLELGWTAGLNLEERAAMTAEWYLADDSRRSSLMLRQIEVVSTRLSK